MPPRDFHDPDLDPDLDARPDDDELDEESDDDPVDGEDERHAALADDEAELDEAFPLGDGVADTEAEVWCPYCGEPNEVGLDPGGGPVQEYVEDCQVCCQPWRVFVTYLEDGSAAVAVEPANGD